MSTVITVDGVVLGAGDVKNRYAFNEMTVQRVNHIDAYNSDAVAAVEVTVTYVISPDGCINVHVQLTALSDSVIERYYGLQSRTFKSTKTIRMSSVEHKARSYFESADATTWEMDVFDRYWVAVNLEPTGLGDFSYCVDKPHAFNLSYGKTYFNLINNAECPVSKGSSVEWSGSYVFKGPVNDVSAVQDAVKKETKVTVPMGVVERYIECGNILSY